MVRMTEEDRRIGFDALIAQLQECESECHRLGLAASAHAVNAAKNKVGWEYAGRLALQEDRK